jgi:Protein of unknown function (DUF2510)
MTTPRQPGWYDDPDDSNAVRYWDGQDWTPHREPKSYSRQTPPVVPAPSGPPAAQHELDPGQALPPLPWYRRPGILRAAAFAALIAEVAITVSGPGDPGTAPGSTTAASTPWSASFSLISTGWWTPDPTASPPAEHQTEPPAAAPRAVAQPPPPPSQLIFRHEPLTAIVSITNNANRPAVGCVYRSVAVAGEATTIHYDHSVDFTVTGSAETKVHVGNGPATGSTFHVTVTCNNGLSTNQDVTY